MTCEVKVILASQQGKYGTTLWTLQLRYWRAIHSELMTHRVFSRNAGSSRAKPVKKVLAQVWSDPAGPIHWGVNQPGMQARAELVGWKRAVAGALWRTAGKVMCMFAWGMMKVGLHKQVANRVLEPWQYIDVLVSSTEWENFFKLRDHPDAQPEFQELARKMRAEMVSWRNAGNVRQVKDGEWHLPYIFDSERATYRLETLLKLSTARAARVSFEPFNGDASLVKELDRHDQLVNANPPHSSPTEHQAMCTGEGGAGTNGRMWANFRGFRQYRWQLENVPTVPFSGTYDKSTPAKNEEKT